MADFNIPSAGPDAELLRSYLFRFPDCHNSDWTITEKEAACLLDADKDGVPATKDDWKQASSPFYPISRLAFNAIASMFNFSPPFALGNELKDVAKADLHFHLGGGTPIRFLYEQALDRVGGGALNPEAWDGALEWNAGANYTNYHNFKKVSVDESVRLAHIDKTIPNGEYADISAVISNGQDIRRRLKAATTDEERSILEKADEENFKKFERLATYMPESSPSLQDFLNVYNISVSLVERTQSLTAQRAAMEYIMRSASDEAVLYMEVRVGTPRISVATKEFPGVSEEDALTMSAEKTFGNIIQAIQDSNKKLVSEEKDPVDLRIVYTLSKGASMSQENLLQTKAILAVLKKHPDWARFIVALDGAAKEQGEPPNIYKEHFGLIKSHNLNVTKNQRLGITWHQGEIFDDTSLFDSIRRVDNLIDLGVSRTGHGLVLGYDPALFAGQTFKMPVDEYLGYLNYESAPDRGFQNPVHIFVDGAETEIGNEIDRVNALKTGGVKEITGRYPSPDDPKLQEFVDAIRERQLYVLDRMKSKDIPVEINPTSNCMMSVPYGKMENHPYPFIAKSGVKVIVNTDDAAIFGVDLMHEMGLVFAMGEYGEDNPTNLVRSAFKFSIPTIVRGETLEYLR